MKRLNESTSTAGLYAPLRAKDGSRPRAVAFRAFSLLVGRLALVGAGRLLGLRGLGRGLPLAPILSSVRADAGLVLARLARHGGGLVRSERVDLAVRGCRGAEVGGQLGESEIPVLLPLGVLLAQRGDDGQNQGEALHAPHLVVAVAVPGVELPDVVAQLRRDLVVADQGPHLALDGHDGDQLAGLERHVVVAQHRGRAELGEDLFGNLQTLGLHVADDASQQVDVGRALLQRFGVVHVGLLHDVPSGTLTGACLKKTNIC